LKVADLRVRLAGAIQNPLDALAMPTIRPSVRWKDPLHVERRNSFQRLPELGQRAALRIPLHVRRSKLEELVAGEQYLFLREIEPQGPGRMPRGEHPPHGPRRVGKHFPISNERVRFKS